jgi:hypothetical protein
MGADVGRSSGGPDHANFRAFSIPRIDHEKRVRLGVNAQNDGFPGPLPSKLGIAQMRNVFMGILRMRLGDAGYLYVCHSWFLSGVSRLKTCSTSIITEICGFG